MVIVNLRPELYRGAVWGQECNIIGDLRGPVHGGWVGFQPPDGRLESTTDQGLEGHSYHRAGFDAGPMRGGLPRSDVTVRGEWHRAREYPGGAFL